MMSRVHERPPRPRLCLPLPPLPDPRDVVLTHHVVGRYISRHYGDAPQRFALMHRELRALVDAGEVVRHRPDFLPPQGRFERRPEVIGYVIVKAHGQHLALPLQVSEACGDVVVATTVLLSALEPV